MRDFKGMNKFVDEHFAKQTNHRFHALGCEMSPEMFGATRKANSERQRMGGTQPWSTQVDVAWVACLLRGGAIDSAKATTLFRGLNQIWDDNSGVSGEERLFKVFAGEMDLASTVNFGRTLQEPMTRMKLRDKLLDVFDDTFKLLNVVHKLAMENLETIMIGHTHMNHGQPITYAHFMISVFDGIFRSLEQLEMAYRFTNLNSGGCGSCSGTTWKVDRELMADLLGMDGVVEPTYDCEASQDHSMAIMFALSNMGIHLSRYSITHNIWALDELDMIRTHPSMCGVSSYMPQKCDSGSNYERVRIKAADVMGETVKSMLQLKSELHGDVLQAAQLPGYAIEAMIDSQESITLFTSMLNHTILQKDRMLKMVKAGYSCATEVATYLIQERGYGGRLAHSIVATMVRDARMQGLKSYQCTGAMLDDAAVFLDVNKPNIDTATLQICLDPEEFIKKHDQLGGTAPAENRRLLIKRQGWLDAAAQRHTIRKNKVKQSVEKLTDITKNAVFK
ncbi:MAG: hypothetical protein L3J71_01655 [Victivallaceae bacterium]|nr:hypothetical protein [Victivallaceae bacterium]